MSQIATENEDRAWEGADTLPDSAGRRLLGGVAGLLWLVELWIWLKGHPALDSDALAVGDMARGLLRGGSLGDWNTCPHPYVFPDLPACALAWILRPDWPGRQVVFGLAAGLALWVTLAALLARLWRLSPWTARAYAGAGLLLPLPFLASPNGLAGAFVPGYHIGALLCTAGLAAWSLGQDRAPSAWPRTLAMGAWLGATWASDALTPLWALPCLALTALVPGSRARRSAAAAAALGWLLRGALLGAWERLGMRVERFRWGYFLEHARAQCGAFLAALPGLWARDHAPLLMALAAAALMASQRRGNPAAARFATALLALGLAGLGVACLEGGAPGRYFSALVWLGAPCLPLALGRRPGVAPALALAGALGAAWMVPRRPPAEEPALLQARWLGAQLAARGLDAGVADYWHARPLRLLVGGDPALAPAITVGGRLEPFPVSTDRRIFARVPRAQFVVLEGLDPAAVRATLGPPREALRGPGLTLWIYAGPPARRPAAVRIPRT